MGLDPISAATQAATGLISGISGLFQKARANQLEKQNVRPVYNIPQEIAANQQIAQQQATQGMPQAQYQRGLQNINRNATNALSAAQDRQGGLSSIGAIQQGANDATLNLTAQDAQQRVANIRNLMSQNQVMAQYRDKAWGWNNQAKYQENAAAIRALRGAGNANINAGLNGILGAGASILSTRRPYNVDTSTVGTTPIDTSYNSPTRLMNYLNFRNTPDGSMYVGGQ